MVFASVLIAVGLALLIRGADWLVGGAASIAKCLGVSALAIGLTIVAFGTSAPELVVSILASARGSTDIAIGNIIGSNIANILLILGVTAALAPLTVTKGTVWKEIPLALLAVIALAIMANDALFDRYPFAELGRVDGMMLIAFFIIFLYYVWSISRETTGNEQPVATYTLTRSTAMVLGGLAGLTIGGRWVVEGATTLATSLGVSEALIGLTVVAVGTSLPELATSAVAAYRKNSDIAVGNIVGSNIFNIFWILGVSAIIRPLPFSAKLNFDIAVTLIATLLLFAAMFVGRRRMLERWQGWCFLALYATYIGFLIARG